MSDYKDITYEVGANAVRINFSHGSSADFDRLLEREPGLRLRTPIDPQGLPGSVEP